MKLKTTLTALFTSVALAGPVTNVTAQVTEILYINQKRSCTGLKINMDNPISDYAIGKLFIKIDKSDTFLETLRKSGKTNEQIFEEYLPISERVKIHGIFEREITCQLGLIESNSKNWEEQDDNKLQEIAQFIRHYEEYRDYMKSYGINTEKYEKDLSTILSTDNIKEIKFLSRANDKLTSMKQFSEEINVGNWGSFDWIFDDFNENTTGNSAFHSEKAKKMVKELNEVTPQYLLAQLHWMENITNLILKQGASPNGIMERLGLPLVGGPSNSFSQLKERWDLVIHEAEKYPSPKELTQKLDTSKTYLMKQQIIISQLEEESDMMIAEFLAEELRKNNETTELIRNLGKNLPK